MVCFASHLERKRDSVDRERKWWKKRDEEEQQ